MKRSRVWIRALLGLTLVAACLAAAIAPALSMVQAAPPPARAAATSADLLISSFRFQGAGGTTDEYIAIYNGATSGSIDLSTYQLRASAAALKPQWSFILPSGIVQSSPS